MNTKSDLNLEEVPTLQKGTTQATRLIAVTPEAEKIIGYCARVSNPQNQDNPAISGLLTYCLKNGHWSIFEQAAMTIEITTSAVLPRKFSATVRFRFRNFRSGTPRRMRPSPTPHAGRIRKSAKLAR